MHSVPVWVKLHDVPLAGFTEDGLSIMASKIGVPIMLDSYTSTMCKESWGRSNFARAMIEIVAEHDMKDQLHVAIPSPRGKTNSISTIRVEYKWKLPRCSGCAIFGHTDVQCPKHVINKMDHKKVDDEGYEKVVQKQQPKKDNVKNVTFAVGKPKQNLVYRPVNKQQPPKKVVTPTRNKEVVETSNSFGALENEDEGNRATTSIVFKSFPDKALVDVESDVEDDDNDPIISGENKTEESHVDVIKLSNVCASVFHSRQWTSNSSMSNGGTRIIMGWNPLIVNVIVIDFSDQVIHCLIHLVGDNKRMYVSIVYAKNYYIHRRSVWDNLCKHTQFVGDHPWVIIGDFNVSLNLDDSMSGGSQVTLAMREFRECVDYMKMRDVSHSGLQFTWNQRPNASDGILKKIDRVMENDVFVNDFSNAYAIFLPYRISDHSSAILKIPSSFVARAKPFKFSNFIVYKEGFDDIVLRGWKRALVGHTMFQLRIELDNAQSFLDSNPYSVNAREDHYLLLQAFNDAILDVERFLQQKAKIEWLRVGDSNTSYFHKVVKGKQHRNHILSVEDNMGNIIEGLEVPSQFVSHYTNFLGTTSEATPVDIPYSLFTRKISHEKAVHLIRPVLASEVKSAIFDVGNNKSPGPDDYTAEFFKSSWAIVGDEVTKAVQEFFTNGQLLSEINHTVIALIAKVESPSKVTDYRPIAYCNVIYKCISKNLANRIKEVLGDIININQSAFVSRRRISDNILLTQELMRNYHLQKGVPRCAFKVDIQKAYDTVSWEFLEIVLHRFSLGYGQGDPISPYFFTIVMEVLSLILADSAMVTTEWSGLVPSMPKSKAFFANVRQSLKDQIMDILPFEEGSLLVKYLGVPLISSRLYYRDCKVLVDNSVFILPSATLNEIEALMRGFLWCQGTFKKVKQKLSGKTYVYQKPKMDHSYKLAGQNFWNVDTTSSASWSWRKILGVRDQVKDHFVHIVGNGECTSVWYDVWCEFGPLSKFIMTRMIYREGFDPSYSIRDMVLHHDMIWPDNWIARFPQLANATVTMLNNEDDVIKWQDNEGKLRDFAVHWVWEYVRSMAPNVPWYSVIWFTHNIPKHALVMWLLMGEKLKTRDKLKRWEVANNQPLLCALCDQVPDSHDHLFFVCPYSLQVWNRMQGHMEFPIFIDSWKDFTLLVIQEEEKIGGSSLQSNVRYGSIETNVNQLEEESPDASAKVRLEDFLISSLFSDLLESLRGLNDRSLFDTIVCLWRKEDKDAENAEKVVSCALLRFWP
ncbi:uncharacterized protein [Rutidosis leptorrhynchoides]|uniref:uncharacterized protein n=1 Tax=Rutidosis leptorrhynchoides TaxID=125765 RepID=UPI003A9945C3